MLLGRLVVVGCLILLAGWRPEAAAAAPGDPITLEAEAAQISTDRAEVVHQDTFPSKQGVSLKQDVVSNVGLPDTVPDLVFRAKVLQAGRYWIRTHAATDAKGTEAMRVATGKDASRRLMISVDGSRPARRVVFVPWSPPDSCIQATGKFGFSGQEQGIRIWLPEGVRLDYLQIAPYSPPEVPDAAAAHQPTIVPPQSRPRLWVNKASLPQVRANLDKGENAPARACWSPPPPSSRPSASEQSRQTEPCASKRATGSRSSARPRMTSS